MSRSSDGIEPVILTRRAFVILQLFSSRACPRWSLMRSRHRHGVRLRARTTTPDGVCPRCGGTSRRVNAWHVRRLSDLPVAGRSLMLELHVRRLVCQSAACPQRTFRQQPGPVSGPGYAGRSAEEPGTRSPCTPCLRRAWVASTSQPDRPLPERTGTGTRAWRSRRTTSARTATDGSRSSASRSGTGAAWQPRWASRS